MEIVVGSHDFLVKDVGDVEEASRNASLIQYDHCRDSCLFFFEDPNTSDMQGNGWEVSPRAGEHMNSVVEHVGDGMRQHRNDYIIGEDVAARHWNGKNFL
jgi:hypothetical protein